MHTPPTFTIHTYGCQMNVRDSDLLSRALRSAGYDEASEEKDADIVIVNSCSVRAKAEEKALGKLGLLCASRRTHAGRVVGLTGCMAARHGEPVFKLLPGLSLSVGPRPHAAIASFVARCLETGETGLGEFEPGDELPLCGEAARAGTSPVQSFVTILYGCNQHCSYCIVPFVRGHEESRDPRRIVDEVRLEYERGARDVCLLGQSVMRYGRLKFAWPDDIPSHMGFTEPFPRLLELIAREIPELPRIRFTSGHPSGVTDELVRAMRELPQVCAHIHLPMQSGSDRVLASMHRGYDRARYMDAVRRLRDNVPDIAITTDVIVGYPGETEEDFEATRSAMEEAAFDNSFVFKYSPRPGTPSAENMKDDVTDDEKRRRDQVLLADQDARGQRLNDAWVGRTVDVLYEGPSLRNSERGSGRTEQNKIVVFEPTPDMTPGKTVRVKITSARPQTLYGDAVAHE